MLDISILVPTRGRPQRLEELFESFQSKTKNKKVFEFVFITDSDETSSKENIIKIGAKYPDITYHILVRDRSPFLNRDYYNWAATQIKSKFYWVFGDDVTIVVEDWDDIILPGLEHYCGVHPDRIVCASIKDNTPVPSHLLPKFPCFPLFSRETFLVTGMLLYPKVPTWGADYVAYEMYEPVGRLLRFEDRNYLNHKSSHTHQVPEDETNKRIGDIFNALKGVPEHNIQRILVQEIPEFRLILTNYMTRVKEERGFKIEGVE